MNCEIIAAYAATNNLTIDDAEAAITASIIRTAKAVGPRYKFGYHTDEDMIAEATLEGLQAIERGLYDPLRPLENFLHVHMKNRLYNLMRKHYLRLEPPCACCNPVTGAAVAGGEASPCRKWQNWRRRNATKQNLMRPLDATAINPDGEDSLYINDSSYEEAVASELEAVIDRNLPVELRSDYRRLREGVFVPKGRTLRVREAVAKIARDAGYLEMEESDDV